MPAVPFSTLPDSARVWVFGSDRPLPASAVRTLLTSVDRFLEQWRAHGTPLTCARDWLHDRFLVVGVDEAASGVSGCSIDGMFRLLQSLEGPLGASLVGGGRVYYRDAGGSVVAATRDEFGARAAAGDVRGETRVFDPTIATVGELRERFETDVARSWHAQLLPDTPAPQPSLGGATT